MYNGVIKSSLVHKEPGSRVIKDGNALPPGAEKPPEQIKLEQTLQKLTKKIADAEAKFKVLTEDTNSKVKNAKAEAEKSLNSAREEASEVLRNAREEADRLKEESRIDGFADGVKRGEAEGLKKFDNVTAKITGVLDNLQKQRTRILKNAEKEVLELALGIARKIIHREVTLDPQIALENTRAAIEKVAAQRNIRILVNEQDYSEVASHRDELLTRLKGVDGIDIVADSYIGPGGCLIEAELGNIDATIESQFEEMKRVLEEMVSAEDDETENDSAYDIGAAAAHGPTASDLKKSIAEEHLNDHLNGNKAGEKQPGPARPQPPSSVTTVRPTNGPPAKPQPGGGPTKNG